MVKYRATGQERKSAMHVYILREGVKAGHRCSTLLTLLDPVEADETTANFMAAVEDGCTSLVNGANGIQSIE